MTEQYTDEQVFEAVKTAMRRRADEETDPDEAASLRGTVADISLDDDGARDAVRIIRYAIEALTAGEG